MKYSSKLFTTALALSGLLVASQAHAVPETFIFTGNSAWTMGDLTFASTTGNGTLRVGGFRGNAGNNRAFIGSNGAGLVVCSGNGTGTGAAVANNCAGDQHTIDNVGPNGPGANNENVKFTFEGLAAGVEVELVAVQFSFVDGNDDFALRVGNTARGGNRDISGTGTQIFSFAGVGGDLTDTMFRIGARGGDNNDDFKLRGLAVNFTTPPPPPPPVSTPEPSTLLMLGSGLAGLGFWRMRKSNKA